MRESRPLEKWAKDTAHLDQRKCKHLRIERYFQTKFTLRKPFHPSGNPTGTFHFQGGNTTEVLILC